MTFRSYGSLSCVLLAACGPLALTACSGTSAAGGLWSGPTIAAEGAALVDVSCPTTSTCTAVDEKGSSVSFIQGGWSPPVPIAGASSGASGNPPIAISCGAAESCAAALGNGGLPLYDGTTWDASEVEDSAGAPTSLSCPTSRFCVAVDDAGQVLTRNGTWTAPIVVDRGGGFASISCTSQTFCLAVTGDTPATAYRFDGKRWSPVAAPNPSTPQGGSEPDILSSVSCATPSSCVALDDFGEAFTWNGHVWSGATAFDDVQDGSDAVSCPTSRFCMIVDGNGVAVSLVEGALGSRHQLDTGAAGLNSISCATATRCVAVGGGGRVYAYSGGPTS